MFQFAVPDMHCGACARRVTNAILSVDPKAEVVTDPPARDLQVTTQAEEQAILAALAEAGYPAERKGQQAPA
ncbi:copper chaperone [Paracoccus sp. S-4012]|uniref:heavy-metal-associated domain-containing protein n=1 Tax=Paracoccus sp. S-4012 TaxID=2665648 RepID=UPI0012B06442|nr:heavy-metal-associated domain-containing protein [Paracoccus sp. S-4012]MRX50554.1 copper chaperone [Paracoccus sp. S-4012]